MIEAELARKLIERITQYTDYNINIMNEEGVIIASRDPGRVGTFHAIAYQLLRGSEDMIEVSDAADYPGVLPGINMIITIDDRREGVIGVTGAPEEIKPVALITKMAIEAVLKYELQQESVRRHLNQKERFVNLLTRNEFSDPELLRSIGRKLHYTEELLRVPILCRIEKGGAANFLHLLKESSGHSKEDISVLTEEGDVLIFKTLPEKDPELFSEYKYRIGEYLSTALRWLRREEIGGSFYIGSFQKNFSQYYYSYHHCLWLAENLKGVHSAYFYDHIGAYQQSILPAAEMSRMFRIYGTLLEPSFQASLVELEGALIDANYNFPQAARMLYIHKNTLQYRYTKVKRKLNIDPIARASDRQFLENLYYYLKKKG